MIFPSHVLVYLQCFEVHVYYAGLDVVSCGSPMATKKQSGEWVNLKSQSPAGDQKLLQKCSSKMLASENLYNWLHLSLSLSVSLSLCLSPPPHRFKETWKGDYKIASLCLSVHVSMHPCVCPSFRILQKPYLCNCCTDLHQLKFNWSISLSRCALSHLFQCQAGDRLPKGS